MVSVMFLLSFISICALKCIIQKEPIARERNLLKAVLKTGPVDVIDVAKSSRRLLMTISSCRKVDVAKNNLS